MKCYRKNVSMFIFAERVSGSEYFNLLGAFERLKTEIENLRYFSKDRGKTS